MEYKLHNTAQGLIMWSINSTTCTGINNVEYKLISVPFMIVLIAVYIGYVEIIPRPLTGINNVEYK